MYDLVLVRYLNFVHWFSYQAMQFLSQAFLSLSKITLFIYICQESEVW